MAFDTFLKLEGGSTPVDGEATRKGHEGWIEVYSFSFGASNPTTVGTGQTGLSAGKVSVSSFNIMKKTEASSAHLFAACCQGTHFKKATVVLNKASGDKEKPLPFLTYKFTDVMVESVQWSGSTGGDDTPTESISFAFAKVEILYAQQSSEKGGQAKTHGASWDLTTAAATTS
ncbi:MAG TPA: type VI secretion system tube protein Hcp [Bryobacteraceae bacterium]|nr:type VI secretion system tube protein Hcp [Bryobacteraceae bacterium]